MKTEDQIIMLLRELKEERRVMLVSTFTRPNLERAFGTVLRHFTLEGSALDGEAA